MLSVVAEKPKLTVVIQCSNAAFSGDLFGAELARMLRDAAKWAESTVFSAERDHQVFLRDRNGNTCGAMTFETCIDEGDDYQPEDKHD